MRCGYYVIVHSFFFFFQAEDGIRDADVTGVQTCALPISVMRMPSGEAKLTQPSQPLYGINTADPHVVLFAGGYPLFVNGKFVGAFGVGGGSWGQDEKIGRTVLKAFEAETK